MTLVDAVRTGRRFKRPFHGVWTSFDGMSLMLSEADILATDWQVEEPTPRLRLYLSDTCDIAVFKNAPGDRWKPLSRAEFDALFEGE
jgi:hypothetical protein